MSPRVMVSGASGFVGRNLVPALAGAGCEVAILDRQDGERGPRHVVDRIDSFQPEAVIHLATHFLSTHRTEDIPALVRANVEFGTMVAEGTCTARARFINIGSAWQRMGGSAYRPVSLYAATKQALSSILDYYVDAQGLDVRTEILFDTYGPGDVRPKLVPSLLRAVRDGVTLDMSDGGQFIDLTYVDDIVSGIAMLALDGHAPVESVLRSWHPITVRDLVRSAAEAVGRDVPVHWGARPSRTREMREDWVFGSSPEGWTPKVHLVDGLRRTWEALSESGPQA